MSCSTACKSCKSISSELLELIRKFGGVNYDSAVYFHPNVNKIGQDAWRIDYTDIKTYLKPLLGEDTIIWVGIYKTPIWYHQRTDLIAFHAFVIFQTRNWWWSAEKTTDGVSVCRGKTLESVRCLYRGNLRKNPLQEIVADKSNLNLLDMVDFLYNSHLVKDNYDLITSNCQMFAAALFNEIAFTQHIDHIRLHHTKDIVSKPEDATLEAQ